MTTTTTTDPIVTLARDYLSASARLRDLDGQAFDAVDNPCEQRRIERQMTHLSDRSDVIAQQASFLDPRSVQGAACLVAFAHTFAEFARNEGGDYEERAYWRAYDRCMGNALGYLVDLDGLDFARDSQGLFGGDGLYGRLAQRENA